MSIKIWTLTISMILGLKMDLWSADFIPPTQTSTDDSPSHLSLSQNEQNKSIHLMLDLDPEPFNQNLDSLIVAPNSDFQIAIYVENLPLVSGQVFEIKADTSLIAFQGFELPSEGERSLIFEQLWELGWDFLEKIEAFENAVHPLTVEALDRETFRISTKVLMTSSRILAYRGDGLVGIATFRVRETVSEIATIEIQIQNHKIQYALLGLLETIPGIQIGKIKLIPQIVGDFNGSGYVDFIDFLLFAQAFGTHALSPNWQPVFDLNQDGLVDFADFLLFAENFGKRTK